MSLKQLVKNLGLNGYETPPVVGGRTAVIAEIHEIDRVLEELNFPDASMADKRESDQLAFERINLMMSMRPELLDD